MQQPKRYQAPTLAEAYEQVRRELGDGAVILSTRKAFAPGLFGQPGRQFVEVVARVPEPEPLRPEPLREVARPTLDQDQAAHDLVRAVAEATAAAPVPAARGPFAGLRDTATPVPASHAREDEREESTEAGRHLGGASVPSLARQLDQVRGMLEQLLTDRMEARMDAAPAATRAVKERLLRHGVPASLAASLLAEVDVRAEEEGAVAAAVERRLASKLPPVATLNLARRRAVFLVGPSGAGKTTMAVRLALQLQREGLKVVIAGTDVHRAGAPQQLLAFGAATGLEVRLCYAPDELAEVVADPEVDAVIIDTPGHNGLRRDRMAELESFLQSVRQRTVLLAVPATMKGSDLGETVAAYSAAGLDGLVLTRCDETSHVGALAAVAAESAIGVAFTTHSDQVSDPAVPGDNAALAAATLRAAWPAPGETLAEADTPGVPEPAPRKAGGARRRLARVG